MSKTSRVNKILAMVMGICASVPFEASAAKRSKTKGLKKPSTSFGKPVFSKKVNVKNLRTKSSMPIFKSKQGGLRGGSVSNGSLRNVFRSAKKFVIDKNGRLTRKAIYCGVPITLVFVAGVGWCVKRGVTGYWFAKPEQPVPLDDNAQPIQTEIVTPDNTGNDDINNQHQEEKPKEDNITNNNNNNINNMNNQNEIMNNMNNNPGMNENVDINNDLNNQNIENHEENANNNIGNQNNQNMIKNEIINNNMNNQNMGEISQNQQEINNINNTNIPIFNENKMLNNPYVAQPRKINVNNVKNVNNIHVIQQTKKMNKQKVKKFNDPLSEGGVSNKLVNFFFGNKKKKEKK